MTEQTQSTGLGATQTVDPKLAQAAADKAKAEALAVPAHASEAQDGQALAQLPHHCDLNTVADAVQAHVAHRVDTALPGAKKPNWAPQTSFRLFVQDVLDPPTPESGEVPADQKLIKVVVHREPTDDECDLIPVWNPALRDYETRRTPKDPSFTHNVASQVSLAASAAGLTCKVVAIHRDGALIEFSRRDSGKPGPLTRLLR